jgi:hypothetical protein
MKSRWYELKDKAISLRKKGFSIGKIERDLGIPRSTLSGWLKNIKLNEKQKKALIQDRHSGLMKARQKAILWHNAQKQKRLKQAEEGARAILKNIDINNNFFLEIAMAFLYLGEGSKKNIETALGSSDPKILKFFLKGLQRVYKIDINKIKCELHLRADQNPVKMKRYWSETLHLPISNFNQVYIDKRTTGTVTYPHYMGVCHMRCGNVAIQRKLIFLANLYCEKLI